ncbi:DNA replication protein psf2 [Agyrium rufum]|nr:DNA replication protein psf2 [Agyrium rufum]
MASTLPPGLTPAEVAFVCEMELVTVIPRQRLEGLNLLGGPTPALHPSRRANIPLWLALLLVRQRRVQIMPPPWLASASLAQTLEEEKQSPTSFTRSSPLPPANASFKPSSSKSTFGKATSTSFDDNTAPLLSPPFITNSSTADASSASLPYHWMEIGELVLNAMGEQAQGTGSGAEGGFSRTEEEAVRGLMRDLREVRMAKVRAQVKTLQGGKEADLTGVGGMEISGSRGFFTGVVDGLRKIGASRELTRKEREENDRDNGMVDEDDDDDMSYA